MQRKKRRVIKRNHWSVGEWVSSGNCLDGEMLAQKEVGSASVLLLFLSLFSFSLLSPSFALPRCLHLSLSLSLLSLSLYFSCLFVGHNELSFIVFIALS